MERSLQIISVLLFLAMPCIAFCQEEEWSKSEVVEVSGAGESVDKETAFRLACQSSLKEFLSRTLPRDTFVRFERDIEKHIATSYKKYFCEKPVAQAWDGWSIKISGIVKKDHLLSDIQYYTTIPDLQGKVALLEWDDKMEQTSPKHTEELKKIVESQFESVLLRYGMKFTTPQQIIREMEQEAKETGNLGKSEEMIYQENNKTQFTIKISLFTTLIQKIIAKQPMNYWEAKLGVEVFLSREKKRIFHAVFPPQDAGYGTKLVSCEGESKKVCEDVVTTLSKISANQVAEYFRQNKPLPATMYVLQFVGFGKTQKRNILKAFDHIQHQGHITEMQRGTGGGEGLKIIVHSKKPINVFQNIVTTYCEEEGVQMVLDPDRQNDVGQNFYFIPKENW